jgi:dethiobiotin synthetase
MRRAKQKTKDPSPRGTFITATDTGVGKTVVTAALAVALCKHGYSVGVMKPIETGVPSSADAGSDAAQLRAAARSSDALTEIRPYAFRRPLAPLDAARLEKITVTLPTIMRAFHTLQSRHEVVLVEGVGGVHVPITSSLDVSDLIYRMKLPALVVGRVSLGGINHALLTLGALRQRKISILALVLNQTLPAQTATARAQECSTVRLLRQLAGVPVIGPLPYRSTLERNFHSEVARLAKTAALTKLMRLVLASGQGTLSRRG